MPPIPNLICASLVVCERVLNEKDDFLSAIRLSDVVYVRTSEARPIQANSLVIHCLFVAKLYEKDGTPYDVHFKITNPHGTVSDTLHRKMVITSVGDIAEAYPGGSW